MGVAVVELLYAIAMLGTKNTTVYKIGHCPHVASTDKRR
jgi:hypothetical protein